QNQAWHAHVDEAHRRAIVPDVLLVAQQAQAPLAVPTMAPPDLPGQVVVRRSARKFPRCGVVAVAREPNAAAPIVQPVLQAVQRYRARDFRAAAKTSVLPPVGQAVSYRRED